MTVWDELKPVIARLLEQQPGALTSYPAPDWDEGRIPPFKLRLAPRAAETAAELHRQFGEDVELTVGALPYPLGRPERPRRAPVPLPDLLDPREVAVELDGPAVVSYGNTLHHHLRVSNRSGGELQIATNGQVTAVVVDLQTSEVVGGYSGAQTLPLKVFRASPGTSVQIPLLIGTASYTPRLGYIVPAGEWGIRATLTLGPHPRDSPHRRTPILPLTITG